MIFYAMFNPWTKALQNSRLPHSHLMIPYFCKASVSYSALPYIRPHNKWHLPLFILFNIKWRGAKDWCHLLPQNANFALTIRKVWFLRPIMCICNVFIFARHECCEAARFACTGICLLEKDWPKTAEWDRVPTWQLKNRPPQMSNCEKQ